MPAVVSLPAVPTGRLYDPGPDIRTATVGLPEHQTWFPNATAGLESSGQHCVPGRVGTALSGVSLSIEPGRIVSTRSAFPG